MGFLCKESIFVVACLLKRFSVNTNMIAGGRKEGTTKDLKVMQLDWVMLGELFLIISIILSGQPES